MPFLRVQDEKIRVQLEELEEKMADILAEAIFLFLKNKPAKEVDDVQDTI